MVFSSLKNLMADHKRKPKRSEIMIVDESALAKSAAWAWYEHGSGSDGRSLREVDVRSSKPEPTPSRYKLEVLSKVNSSSSRRNSLLLDNYEIERISKQLDQYIETTHAKIRRDPNLNKVALKKNFWSRHVPVCGSSRNDVVEYRPVKGGVPVVGDVSCRPRPRAIRV